MAKTTRIWRRMIPYYITGEEVGGIILGRWLTDAELKGTTVPYEIPLEPKKIPGTMKDSSGREIIAPLEPGTKIRSIYYAGGMVQMPNKAKEKDKFYKLPFRTYIIFRLLPLLLSVFYGYQIIGLWHSHKPGNLYISKTDEEAADAYLKQWGVDKMLLAVESGGDMVIRVHHAKGRTINTKWD